MRFNFLLRDHEITLPFKSRISTKMNQLGIRGFKGTH